MSPSTFSSLFGFQVRVDTASQTCILMSDRHSPDGEHKCCIKDSFPTDICSYHQDSRQFKTGITSTKLPLVLTASSPVIHLLLSLLMHLPFEGRINVFQSGQTNLLQSLVSDMCLVAQLPGWLAPTSRTTKCTRRVLFTHHVYGSRCHSSVYVCYLIYVWVPVLVVLGLGSCAVDSGEEGGLGEVHQSRVQTKRLSNNCLDSPTHISDGEKRRQYFRLKCLS